MPNHYRWWEVESIGEPGFYNPETGVWKHLATLRRPESNLSFSTFASFVEDFGGSPTQRRSALLGNGWIRTFSKTWVELRTARFYNNSTKTNLGAGLFGSMFRLETGGNANAFVANGTQFLRPASSLVAPLVFVPTITAQPKSMAVFPGEGVAFNVAANGNSTLSYQWEKNGVPIVGASEVIYSKPNVQVSDAGFYTVSVTDLEGGVTSVPAVLTVVTDTSSPASLVVGIGQITASPGTPGPVGAFSPDWFAIVSGDSDTPAPSVFGLARGYLSGRVVALGHEGILRGETIGLLDNTRFVTNAMRWLDASGRRKVSYTVGHSEWFNAASAM